MKILISTSTFGKYDQASLNLLKQNGFEVILNPYGRTLTAGELVELAKECVGIIAGTEPLTAEVTKRLPSLLKCISRCGVGMENIDLEMAKQLGIIVHNTPDAPTNAVAELTLGLILTCLRHISRADHSIRSSKWSKSMGELLGTKTVGIVGYGRIGKSVAKLVRAFGAKVITYDFAPVTETAGVSMVPFEELISEADIVTLHLPDCKVGYLIDSRTITRMKEGAFLINTSRGGLVDEKALYQTLKSRRLAGAAIDTFEVEPYTGPLKELENVVLTPHIGSYAREARIRMEIESVKNLLNGLKETIMV